MLSCTPQQRLNQSAARGVDDVSSSDVRSIRSSFNYAGREGGYAGQEPDMQRTPSPQKAIPGDLTLAGEKSAMHERVTSALKHAADMKRQFLDQLQCMYNSDSDDE